MIYSLIVVYNQSCEDILTINKLKKYDSNISIIIFDNSDSEDLRNVNKLFCEKNLIEYLTCGSNVGLSRAYNKVIDLIKYSPNNHIMILDDDTDIDDDYINECISLANLGEFDLYFPIVKTNSFILSPTNFKTRCRSVIVNDINDIDINHCTAINSGMLVKTSVFEKIRYDERLFLDMIDHDFVLQSHINDFKINIMKSELFQHYSREEKGSVNSAFNRYLIYKKDLMTYVKKYGLYYFYVISILKLKFSSAFKYKTLIFIFK